ncbi:hypothetical protein [Nocardia sp. CA-119907]|uniref:hypothetical protein n=1 Tax=Nocardia sp. CA-119907 TaxID=3239973 RepID=UPI003D954890
MTVVDPPNPIAMLYWSRSVETVLAAEAAVLSTSSCSADSVSELCLLSETFADLWTRNDVVLRSRANGIRNSTVGESEIFVTNSSECESC